MLLEVGGVHYSGFNRVRLTIRLDALCDHFSFEAVDAKSTGLPFVAGESCRVYVDEEQQLSGWIEKISVGGDSQTHNIKVEGRSRTCDLADGIIGSLSDFKTTFTIATLTRAVIKHLRSSISVVDHANPASFNPAEDKAAPEAGDNAFAFLEPFARKRQVILGSDAQGRVAIFNGKGRRTGGRIQHELTDESNNVLSYSVGYDHENRFHRYLCIGQPNPAVGGLLSGVTTVANTKPAAEVIDEGARVGRQFVIAGESATSEGQSLARAEWEAKIRRARSVTYSATVSGYRDQEGNLWTINTVPEVNDVYAGIKGRMLINSVTFQLQAEGQGRSTTLGFVEEDAYLLSLTEPTQTKKGTGIAWEGLLDTAKRVKAGAEAALSAELETDES